jgi:uncharacterized membrane protein
MENLNTTNAIYPDVATAQQDWDAVEQAASTDSIYLADAALVHRNAEGDVERIERQSHHGWGKGAVAGAVVGLLFPATIVAGAVAGGVGGGLIARLNRSLDRGDIKDLGEMMDAGEISIVAITSEDSVDTLKGLLTHASKSVTKASATAEEVRAAMDESGPAPTS